MSPRYRRAVADEDVIEATTASAADVPLPPSPTAAMTGSPVNDRGTKFDAQSAGVEGTDVSLPFSIVVVSQTGEPNAEAPFRRTRTFRYWLASRYWSVGQVNVHGA